jgi:hypothetical protein
LVFSVLALLRHYRAASAFRRPLESAIQLVSLL